MQHPTQPSRILQGGLLLARVVLAAVFISSGFAKFGHMSEFHRAILNYGVVAGPWATGVAKTFPWVELFLGLYLLLGMKLRWVSVCMAIFLALFAVMISKALLLGQQFDCGCFVLGKAEPISWKKVGEDVFLTALALGITWQGDQMPYTLEKPEQNNPKQPNNTP